MAHPGQPGLNDGVAMKKTAPMSKVNYYHLNASVQFKYVIKLKVLLV